MPLPIISSIIEFSTAILVFNLILFVLRVPNNIPSMEAVENNAVLEWIRAQGPYFAIGAVAVAATVKGVFRLINLYVQARIVERTVGVAKRRLFLQYLHAPLLFHTHHESSDIIRNLWGQLENVIRTSISTVLSFVSSLFSISALMIPVILVSPKSLLTLLVVISIFGAVALTFAKRFQVQWGLSWHRILSRMLGIIHQSLAGIREIKVYQREGWFAKQYDDSEQEFERLRRLQSLVETTPGIVLEMTLMVGLSVVLMWLTSRGLDLVALGPVLGLVAYSGLRILPLSNAIIMQFGRLRKLDAAIEDVYVSFEETRKGLELAESVSVGFSEEKSADLGAQIQIEFNNVTFLYPSERKSGIENASFSIPGGTSVAFVGPTGAGKSTLLNMLLGFLAPDSGEITVNGSSLAGQLSTWLSRIGYVPQEPFLLSGTIAENVAFAMDPEEMDREWMEETIKAAQLGKWISSMPFGLDTKIGERGEQISGGQRQRIAIARALYRRPSILIMDEPTSAIDSRTERALEKAILGMPGDITRILVTHRLDTARLCDQVVFVENGEVKGVGLFDELTLTNEPFKRFISMSQGRDEPSASQAGDGATS